MKRLLLLALIPLLITSCNNGKKPFSVSDIHFLTNVPESKDSVVKLSMDLSDAVLNGIEIPTKSQTRNGYFNYSFKIKNTSDKAQRFFYKVYYQNESYKFNDNDSLAYENFYGSWNNNKYIFKSTSSLAPGQEVEVTDSFKIAGNPRNERIFYGSGPYKHLVNDATILSTINYMKTIPDWVSKVKENAKKTLISEDEQFYKDALWSINDKRQRDSTENNRWKRNPRVGIYKFMLVVTTPEDFDNIPADIKDLSQKNRMGVYSNPFGYFNGHKDSLANTLVLEGDKNLKVNAKIDLSKGVYVNPLLISNRNIIKDFFNQSCNDSLNRYSQSQTELYFHTINKDFVLHNIPEIKDVVGENYSRGEYQEMVKKYQNSDKLINTFVNVTDCPCKNVSVNKEENSITIKNPGNNGGILKKEHVGLQTRIGFTYGKFRAKIKFTELLSKDNVWNGITNAFWMMAQDVNSSWNMRRECNSGVWGGGYLPKSEPDARVAEDHAKKQIAYSEIDFEIIKESEFWPQSSYKNGKATYKKDDAANNRDIMVTCTNWDMACKEPKKFSVGATTDTIDGIPYILHRWNTWNKSLTAKIPAKHDELFKAPYYYFEIEWAPEKITWRIGPEKDKLKTICVMDKNISSIPSNQMIMIITQEWHNQEWWPTAPFKQNFIPFPKNDIIGKVLELEVE